MISQSSIILVALLALAAPGFARVFKSRCELARELVSKGIPRSQINNWVCLVENESGMNTARVGGPNSNGSFDYGLFQINSRYWCSGSTGTPSSNDCNIRCNDLTNDDITDDVRCAKMVYNRHKFDAWVAWGKKCKSPADVSKCF